jgi:hypothetical protein
MLLALLFVILLLALFGGLGALVHPLFFILLAVVLVLALGGGFYGRGHAH